MNRNYLLILLIISLSSIVSIVMSSIKLFDKSHSDHFRMNDDDLFVTCIYKDNFRCGQHPNCQWNSRLSGPFGDGSCRMSRQLMGSFGNSRILRS